AGPDGSGQPRSPPAVARPRPARSVPCRVPGDRRVAPGGGRHAGPGAARRPAAGRGGLAVGPGERAQPPAADAAAAARLARRPVEARVLLVPRRLPAATPFGREVPMNPRWLLALLLLPVAAGRSAAEEAPAQWIVVTAPAFRTSLEPLCKHRA